LKSAKLRDEDIHHTEEAMLQMNQLSVEEIAQRRGELRKMRELMFRAEVKARRVGKIKSKTYRRIKRKGKEGTGEEINEDDSEDEEGILKKKLDRATERATLRHKHTGKWACQMRNKEGLDEESRKDIDDMLVRGEKLRRRVKETGNDEGENGPARVVRADENDSDSNSEVEAQEAALTLKGKGKTNGIKAFEQRDLIALAFAGDNVVQVCC
jgi:U3 small nucleolar RNA-associated protein 14